MELTPLNKESADSLKSALSEALKKDPNLQVFTALKMCIRNLEAGNYGTALYNFDSDSDKYCRNGRYPEIEHIYSDYKIREILRARLNSDPS